jgi:hypothetical protein
MSHSERRAKQGMDSSSAPVRGGLANNALELTSGELAGGVARASRAQHH